jgi:16S rRNA (adenine1518-N6/adenine1519-N6)-dimethyltransferase
VSPDGLPPLRQVIAAHGLAARKALGQNFILDLNLTAKIARLAGDIAGADVLEIGPGPGGLTRGLLMEGARRVVAVERDVRCLPALAEIAAAYPGPADGARGRRACARSAAASRAARPDRRQPALQCRDRAARALADAPEWPPFWTSMTLMFQREVAERIVAAPGGKAYGRLAILAQWRTEPRIVMTVPPEAFTPPPKVTSAVVRLDRLEAPRFPADARQLSRVVAMAFNQRRKMLRASLRGLGRARRRCCARPGSSRRTAPNRCRSRPGAASALSSPQGAAAGRPPRALRTGTRRCPRPAFRGARSVGRSLGDRRGLLGRPPPAGTLRRLALALGFRGLLRGPRSLLRVLLRCLAMLAVRPLRRLGQVGRAIGRWRHRIVRLGGPGCAFRGLDRTDLAAAIVVAERHQAGRLGLPRRIAAARPLVAMVAPVIALIIARAAALIIALIVALALPLVARHRLARRVLALILVALAVAVVALLPGLVGLPLGFAEKAGVMLGVLEIVLRRDAIARDLRVAREALVLLDHLLGVPRTLPSGPALSKTRLTMLPTLPRRWLLLPDLFLERDLLDGLMPTGFRHFLA